MVDATLHLLKVNLTYHESDHVLNLTYNLMCDGTRLEDIERLRSDVAYMNALNADLIPDATTTGDFTRRFTEADVIELMDCINAVRPSCGTHALPATWHGLSHLPQQRSIISRYWEARTLIHHQTGGSQELAP